MQTKHIDYLSKWMRMASQHTSLTTAQQRSLIDCFCLEKHSDKEVWLKEGQECKRVGILYSGLYKCIGKDKRGHSQLQDLFFNPYNPMVADWDSYTTRLPSQNKIVSAGDSEILCIRSHQIESLSQEHVPVLNLFQLLMHNSDKARMKLIESYWSLKCRKRKLKFAEDYPEVFKHLTNKECCQFLWISKNS